VKAKEQTERPTLEELEGEARVTKDAMGAALDAYLSGPNVDATAGLEAAARRAVHAEFELTCEKHRRTVLEGMVRDAIAAARKQHTRGASLRDPRPFVRGRG
jgi:hypothetical protein